jgi:hypothetical protein
LLSRILAALALLTPAALMAQADKDAIIVTGVVDAIGGGGGFQNGGETGWTSSFNLVAWREGEGPIRTDSLRVEIPGQRQSELARWSEVFPPRTLVRFAIREPVAEKNGRALAVLRAALPRPADAALLAAADPLLNPPPISDPVFGTFTSDRQFPQWFRQKREWLGREIGLILTLDYAGPPGPDAPVQALAGLRAVWEAREAWDARLREAIAADYYAVWADDWRDEGEPLISREAFKARFILDDASFAPDGSFTFTFGDDDLFAGHALMVSYDPETDALHAEMFG